MTSGSSNVVIAPAPIQPAARPGPPQRQSCDRCHKQKLRCIRKESGDGGACDRCSSKRARCVYSSSLPKGRPNLNRIQPRSHDSSKTSTTAGKEGTTVSIEQLPLDAITAPPSPLHNWASMPPLQLDSPFVIAHLAQWEPASWEQMQPDSIWSESLHFGGANLDDTFTAANDLDVTANGHEGSEPYSRNPTSLTHCISDMDAHGQLESGQPSNDVETDGSKRSNNACGDVMMNRSSDKNISLIIAHLAQLSAQLSSLRTSSDALAQDVAPSSFLGEGRFSFTDQSAFDSVATWLTRGERSKDVETNQTYNNCTELSNIDPKFGLDPSFLRDVFCASNRFVEVLHRLEADDISRHLIMACEAMVLEIYAKVLTALEDQIGMANPTVLGKMRLVLMVQLCAYLVEHQHEAVDMCLSPSVANGQLDTMQTFQSDEVDRNPIRELRLQVHEKLAKLRQTLRCT